MPEGSRDPWLVELDRRFPSGPTPDEAGWDAAVRARLEAADLATDDPDRPSGTTSDAAGWERRRRPIAAAIHRDGTFLDVGCANGLLLETLTAWTAAQSDRIEPDALDDSATIAALARRRVPHWADRIVVGNVIDWEPLFRFDVVRTERDDVPLHCWRELSIVTRGHHLLPRSSTSRS